jgi:hypothetical protein
MNSSRATLAIAVLLLAACADDDLPEPNFQNAVETFTIGSLTSTPVTVPSAYSVPDNQVVRTDQSTSFDFAYVRADGRDLLVPLDALGLGGRTSNPGLQLSSLSFDLTVDPPTDGYITSDSVEVEVGDVVVARSRVACYLGVPQYAKLQVKSINPAAGTLTFDAVANVNCGYRSLALGLPRN